jgi:hypothetical protein
MKLCRGINEDRSVLYDISGSPHGCEKKAPRDTRPQSERFIEAAKKSGTDESSKAIEKAFKKVVHSKHSKP